MMSSGQISDLQESNETYIFGKHMTRAIQKYNFYLFWTSISKVMAISHDSGPKICRFYV